MIFRQLFEPLSSTYTYLLGCEDTGQAMLIDPVYPSWERDMEVINSLHLKLFCTIDTHIHADHITSALRFKKEVGSKIAFPALDNIPCADIGIEEGKPFRLGSIDLTPLFTPGHTDDHFSFLAGDRVFTGDSLLIDGCGRTDFQNGNAETLYKSITGKLFSLPDDTLVYPAHDYADRRISNIAQEKKRNARINSERSQSDFVKLMNELELPYPKFIDYALVGNRQCGVCPHDVPERLEEYCKQMTLSPQG